MSPSFSPSFGIVCPSSCETCDDVRVTALQAETLSYIF